MSPVAGPVPSLERERLAWAERRLVVGIDEAGRGPLAGPVVAAAVVFPPGVRRIRGVRDSKALPSERREELALLIRTRAIQIGVGAASNREIDRLNIRIATALAMRRAVQRALGLPRGEPAGQPPGGETYLLILDGLPLPEIGFPHQALVDGDARCYSVAAASIVAKTVRDRIMRCLAPRHPGYGWDTNVGYGTPEHLDGIFRSGATRHHRVSFSPVAQHELWGSGYCSVTSQ